MEDSLWRRVIVARFLGKSFQESNETRGRHGCGIWKSIISGRDEFQKFLRFKIGSNENIRFLMDIWVGESSFKDSFPQAFQLARDPLVMVANCYDENRRIWDLGLRRDPNDWEVDELLSLMGILENLKPSRERIDMWVWKLNHKRYFTSKSFYSALSNFSMDWFPHKSIWIPIIPSKISSFMWNTFLDKILIISYLRNKGQNLANRYILCINEEESVNHLFIHCSMAKGIWHFFISHLQITWVFPKSFDELISGWWLYNLEEFFKDIWKALPGIIYCGL